MLKIFSILITAYKNYIIYLSDILWINIILILRLTVIITLYKYLYSNYSNNDLIFWFTLTQITYWVIVAQIVSTSKPKVVDEIQNDVKSWKISVYLLNPVNYIVFKFLEFFPTFMQNVGFWLVFWFLLWFITTGSFPITLVSFFAWFLLLVWSMLVVFFSYTFIWLLSFYTEDVEAFRFIYSKFDMILGGNILPIPFLPTFLQTIAYASPFAYFWYTSGLVFVSFDLVVFIKYFLIQMFWLFITVISCFLLFNKASKKLTINWG